MNPLLDQALIQNTPPQFSEINNADFQPAFEHWIAVGRKEVDAIVDLPAPADFENTFVALEFAGKGLDRVASIFFNLNSAETNDEMQKIAQEVSPLLSEFSNDILLNESLFKRVKEVHENVDHSALNAEQRMLLDKTYKGFVRNGALLNDEDKQKLRKIDVALSKWSLTFGENILAETNAYELVIEDEKDLYGLPDFAKEQAAETAKEKGKEGKWVITLDYPSYVPFMTYAENRSLRKELSLAFGARAFQGNDKDNQSVVKKIVQLRQERAELLGYNTHAHYVLEERMAESPEKVIHFLEEIGEYGKPGAAKDIEKLVEFAEKHDGLTDLQRWDFAYYSEKLKKEAFEIDDELIKPYFSLDKVVAGGFETAKKLYGISFQENKDITVYHPDVKAYDVRDESGQDLATFYTDFFPRPGKRDGAWMTLYAGQYIAKNTNYRPLVSIVCNFSKPGKKQPSLLTFNEVTTFFHEFGHALHGILSQCTFESLSGPNVYWDFVELPSQILENWCYEKECLDLFATHYETGEAIPESLVNRIIASANFMEGYQTMRQLSFGMLDMAWHGQDNREVKDVAAFENEVMSPFYLLPPLPNTNMSCAFSHIFQGGYSAGYYSYKWAEVLDADAFDYFKSKGIFDAEVATAFRKHILEAGGSEHPMTLYKKFRGQAPDVKPLLKRAGLLHAD